MSYSEHSSVTHTSVSSPVEDYLDIGSPEVDGPPSPDYVPGLEEPEQAPPSPDYVPGPKEPEQAPLSPDYVPGPEEPEQAPLSPNYMPGLEEPKQALLSPDYVPGPDEPEQAPPSPVYLSYVLELVYPEYMPPEDDVFPAEEQPNWAQQADRGTYSASAVDSAVQSCFFEDQLTSFSPKN
nr:hypothetical protein [Tanacetum cinerariifolium]